jgi:hypothetical protein
MIRTIVGMSLLGAIGCGGSLRGMVRDHVAQRGQVLREWQLGNEERMIVREGNRVVEYRILSSQVGISSSAHAEILYAVDTVIGECYTGFTGHTPLPCDRVARDPDMRPYAEQAIGPTSTAPVAAQR